jgi:predicted GIY-YIG superfamily endonuclease
MRKPVVYILASHTGRALYIGVTTNLPRRLAEHRNGEVAREAAEELESRKKIALINLANPDWRDLSGEIHDYG